MLRASKASAKGVHMSRDRVIELAALTLLVVLIAAMLLFS